jgi:hypothetical protein
MPVRALRLRSVRCREQGTRKLFYLPHPPHLPNPPIFQLHPRSRSKLAQLQLKSKKKKNQVKSNLASSMEALELKREIEILSGRLGKAQDYL